jgi:hypothetical protein
MACPIPTVFMRDKYYIFRPVMVGLAVVPVGVEIHVRLPNQNHQYSILLRVITRVVDIQATAMDMTKPDTITGILNLPIDDIATLVAITITVINGGK